MLVGPHLEGWNDRSFPPQKMRKNGQKSGKVLEVVVFAVCCVFFFSLLFFLSVFVAVFPVVLAFWSRL